MLLPNKTFTSKVWEKTLILSVFSSDFYAESSSRLTPLFEVVRDSKLFAPELPVHIREVRALFGMIDAAWGLLCVTCEFLLL